MVNSVSAFAKAIAILLGVAAIVLAMAQPWDEAAKRSVAQARTAAGSDDEYSVFKRPVTAEDALEGWNLSVYQGAAEQLGIQLSARRLVSQDARKAVAAVEAADAPCLMVRYHTGSQGLSCGAGQDTPTAVVGYDGALGLVPDSVQAVRLVLTDGSFISSPVRSNVWTAPSNAVEATFEVRGQVQRVQLMPAERMPEGAKLPEGGKIVGTSRLGIAP